MRRLCVCLGVRLCFAAIHLALAVCAVTFSLPVHADVFGTVRGIVHDPQHRPIPGATVELKALRSAWVQQQTTNQNGEFQFSTVPLGEYTANITSANFQAAQQSVIVESGTSPVLHLQLALASVSQNAVVNAAPVETKMDSVTPTTLLSREDIQDTPGADRSNSMAMITDNIPGAYEAHDQLHIRGGHQVTWMVDGVPVPNTNIASNVGPQFDPKDIDYMEVQRGSYDADYGDRTYGVFNVVPRTGFERDNECDLITSFGNFYQTNDDISCGSHTQRFAYYGSLNGNRSNLGLQPPTPAVIHDAENGLGGFGTLIFNVNSKNQLRLVVSSRRDYYQIPDSAGTITEVPNTPGVITITPCLPPTSCSSTNIYQHDANAEADTFVNFSWVYTINPNAVLTVSPFFHYNSANYRSNPNDLPSATTDDRASTYGGGQVTLRGTYARNSMSGGFYGFGQHDNQLFGVLFNDGSAPNFSDREIANGGLEEFWFEDKFTATSWLTLSGGVRQSHFSGTITENATSPRAGVSVRIPKINWVLHGFYGHFYQAPPLLTFSGLQNAAGGVTFGPLFGERDEEFQFGLSIPYKGWSLDADTFRTRANNFFDHSNINDSEIFVPITISEALIRGWELTLRSPRLWRRGQLHLTYSNQVAEARGNITGGLIPVPNPISPDYSPLDHDQRNTLNVGGEITLPWRSFASGNINYGSGLTNGNGPAAMGLAPCCSSLDYLPAHTIVDLTVGKNFGENLSISVNGLNVANRRVEVDDSLTFGGYHWNNPREVFVELRYRFHY